MYGQHISLLYGKKKMDNYVYYFSKIGDKRGRYTVVYQNLNVVRINAIAFILFLLLI